MFGLLVMLVATPAAVGLAFAKPQQIRSDSSPVFHYYLQRYKDSEYRSKRALHALLAHKPAFRRAGVAWRIERGGNGRAADINTSDARRSPGSRQRKKQRHGRTNASRAASLVVLGPAATGEFFNIGSTIQSANSSLYINIGADSTSYKTLSFGQTATTTAWGLEGDTIITTTSSTYGRRECFSPPFQFRLASVSA